MDKKNSSTYPQSEHLVILPGRITKSHCSACKADLSFLITAIRENRIPWPEFCPECRVPFRRGEVTESVWKCPKCNGIIVDPKKQKYCLRCATPLICPQELLKQKTACQG